VVPLTLAPPDLNRTATATVDPDADTSAPVRPAAATPDTSGPSEPVATVRTVPTTTARPDRTDTAHDDRTATAHDGRTAIDREPAATRIPTASPTTDTPAANATVDGPRAPVAGGVFARRVVTIAAVLAVAACFGFSFGNVLELGRFLGAPDWVAWLIDPAVAVTVAGLVVGVRHLALHGVPGAAMRPARGMLAAAGLTTLSLNIAAALFARGHGSTALNVVADRMAASGSIWWRVGAAGYDAIAPLLLLGWAEVGPWFLRHFHALDHHERQHQQQRAASATGTAVAGDPHAGTPVTMSVSAPQSASVSASPRSAGHRSPTRTPRRSGPASHRMARSDGRVGRDGRDGRADDPAVGQARLAAAHAAGRPDGQPWTARTLAEATGCGKTTAATFLRLVATYEVGGPDGQPWTAELLAEAAGVSATAAASFLATYPAGRTTDSMADPASLVSVGPATSPEVGV
jgi:hypothetical protein